MLNGAAHARSRAIGYNRDAGRRDLVVPWPRREHRRPCGGPVCRLSRLPDAHRTVSSAQEGPLEYRFAGGVGLFKKSPMSTHTP
eukprot:scaffold107953_cov24-Phaeocystis_antarctica.AAC.1